jgi:hypothetical protein
VVVKGGNQKKAAGLLLSAVIICMLTCSEKTASFLKHPEINEQIIWHAKCSYRIRILINP